MLQCFSVDERLHRALLLGLDFRAIARLMALT